MYMTGTADFSNLFDQLIAAGATAAGARAKLQSMAGSGIEFELVNKDIVLPGGKKETVTEIKAKYVGGDAPKNFTPPGGGGGGGGGPPPRGTTAPPPGWGWRRLGNGPSLGMGG